VTLPKIAGGAKTALKGARGPAGPSASDLFTLSKQPFTNRKLATVGAWTIQASCSKQSGTATVLSVVAVGPKDSIGDGSVDGGAYSYNGGTIQLAPELDLPSAFGFHTSELTLNAPGERAAAHVTLFIYGQAPGSTNGFEGKVNGVAFSAA
jgi:hypothetical protein